ncbi:MAG: cytochrome c3 family protein [Candidatus Marinimicrobia bacterium]|nr:cytochrome c3 family protein [Candidatus Neomarinimicrobiota bacterium]
MKDNRHFQTLCIFMVMFLFILSGQNLQLPKSHLEMNTYCMSCHTCDNPTDDNPCLEICPRHGGKFKGTHTVDEGPKIVIMDQLSDIYSSVVFQHELHAGMSEMSGGCDLCHHFSNPDELVPPCRECHKIKDNYTNIAMPSLKAAYHRQCLNCHREWSHETECSTCHLVKREQETISIVPDPTDIMGAYHPRIEAEERYVYSTNYPNFPIVTFHHTDHVDLFGEKCVDCHSGNSCLRCHENGGSDEPPHIENLHSKQTCCNCHTQACREPDQCIFCHKDHEMPKFNHTTSVGWDLGDRHEDVACQSCHGPLKTFIIPSKVCTNCHIHWDLDIFDHGTTGLILTDDHVEFECTECHLNEDFSAPPDCENCHDPEEINYPDSLPGYKNK